MSGLVESLTGNGKNYYDQSTKVAGPTPEETQLIQLNTQLAQKQLDNINNLQPFQQKMLEASMQDLNRQSQLSTAFDNAVSPEDQAAQYKADFERAQRLGPIQDQLLQAQLDAMQGKTSPEQQANIQKAADAAMQAGSSDIDIATQRGIGLVGDEMANARGMRLTDTPIAREATLLARSGEDQKASLSKSIRASQMGQTLAMPMQASSIALPQQNMAQATQMFQQQLRQQAQQNRLSMFGQSSSSGIGLAGLGNGAGTSTLGSLTQARLGSTSTAGTGFDPSKYMTAYGGFVKNTSPSIGNMMESDRRLKTDIELVGALPSGLPLYSFRFIGKNTVHIGVMADEAIEFFPNAVTVRDDGYMLVDYAKLK